MQVYTDHNSSQIHASRNHNCIPGSCDRADIDFRLQLRLTRDPKRRFARTSEVMPPAVYPSDLRSLREMRKAPGLIGGSIEGHYGNLADTEHYIKKAPRYLNAQTVLYQSNLRRASGVKRRSGSEAKEWNSLPHKGGLFTEVSGLEAEPYSADQKALWRSQHKDVGPLFGQKATKWVDVKWPTTLRRG